MTDLMIATEILLRAQYEKLGIPESRMGTPAPLIELPFPELLKEMQDYINSPEYAALIKKEEEKIKNK